MGNNGISLFLFERGEGNHFKLTHCLDKRELESAPMTI